MSIKTEGSRIAKLQLLFLFSVFCFFCLLVMLSASKHKLTLVLVLFFALFFFDRTRANSRSLDDSNDKISLSNNHLIETRQHSISHSLSYDQTTTVMKNKAQKCRFIQLNNQQIIGYSPLFLMKNQQRQWKTLVYAFPLVSCMCYICCLCCMHCHVFVL